MKTLSPRTIWKPCGATAGRVIEPKSGRLACGAVGMGKMPEPEELLEAVDHAVRSEKDLADLQAAGDRRAHPGGPGPGAVFIQPLQREDGLCRRPRRLDRGAEVTLVTGPTALKPPAFVETVEVTSAQEMFDAVTRRAQEQDIIVKAAAVADYRPAEYSENKLKKGEGDPLSLPLGTHPDILLWLGEHKSRASSCAASAWRRSACWKTAGKS